MYVAWRTCAILPVERMLGLCLGCEVMLINSIGKLSHPEDFHSGQIWSFITPSSSNAIQIPGLTPQTGRKKEDLGIAEGRLTTPLKGWGGNGRKQGKKCGWVEKPESISSTGMWRKPWRWDAAMTHVLGSSPSHTLDLLGHPTCTLRLTYQRPSLLAALSYR